MAEKKYYPRFAAVAKGGRLYLDNEGQFSSYLVNMENKQLAVTVKPWVKERSRQEEKYYHAVVVRTIAEAMALPDQDVHEFLKRMFLTTEEKTPEGVRFERVKSTTELTDTEYREFWETCVKWAALPTKSGGLNYDSGLEIYVPYPNEVDFESW